MHVEKTYRTPFEVICACLNVCQFRDIITSLPTLAHKSCRRTKEYDQAAQKASTHLCPQVLPIFARRVSSTSTKGKPHLNVNNSASLLFPRIKTTRGVGLHRKLEPQKPGSLLSGTARDAPAPPPAPPSWQDPPIIMGSWSRERAPQPLHSLSNSMRDSQS